MVCPVRGGDWIVPRRLMCFLFWSGTVLLFAGILLVVTSKHKGQTFLSWGGILLGVGACVLLSCLVLCIHAYYVIAETRSNAEHTLINNLQLQRKAHSSHSRSISMDEVDVDRPDVYTTLDHDHDPKPSSNGGSYAAGSLLTHRATDPTPDGAANAARYRSTPSQAGRGGGGGGGGGGGEMGERTAYQGDGDGRFSGDSSLAISSQSRPAPVYTISQAAHDVVFSPPPLHGFSFPFASSSSSPPTYSQLGASRGLNSPSTSGSRVIASSVPPPPFREEEDRIEEGSLNSRTASASAGVLDSGLEEWRKGQRSQRSQNNAAAEAVVVNSSSQSSAPNSSFEVELDTTDQETPGGPGAVRGRRLNNTPVDRCGGGGDAPCGLPESVLQVRRPGRLNLDGPRTEAAAAAERPVTPGSRRFAAGAESITRPFGLGTVTVTPLYRPPERTPPSRRHQEVVLDVTSRDFGAHRGTVRTPDPHRAPLVRTPDSLRSFRPPKGGTGPPFPQMSTTPFPHDREAGISVCQSDVTVYDNVIDSVRV